ncbi:hypothetical protein SAMN04489806_1672 [Paramicrobacterium humi]|uniref:Helicase associated domain-containing protein n=1 Tax=Paramicrobacterium humi TaxID=640635 RepID=A0A1H4LWV1_9MICO|nr:hypothetical protein [Microbacterium humi]SEB74755.1 hypothetical protein SAMN04489806_1672 [Microbacterium humi]
MQNDVQILIGQFLNASDGTSRAFAEAEQAFHRGVETQGSRRMRRWVATVNCLDRFVLAERRMPRENRRLAPGEIGEQEKSLASWVRYQRRPATRNGHCEYQSRRLEIVDGFQWDPLGEAQRELATQYAEFFTRFGRAPRYRAEAPEERRLANWAAKRRQLAMRGALSAQEVERLRAAGVPVPRRRR